MAASGAMFKWTLGGMGNKKYVSCETYLGKLFIFVRPGKRFTLELYSNNEFCAKSKERGPCCETESILAVLTWAVLALALRAESLCSSVQSRCLRNCRSIQFCRQQNWKPPACRQQVGGSRRPRRRMCRIKSDTAGVIKKALVTTLPSPEIS